MRRLSSSWTLFHKRVLPILWAVMVLVFAAFAWHDVRQAWHAPMGWVPLLVPLIMSVAFVAAYRWLIRGLADEVRQEGDVLRVRRGAEEVRIPLVDIINVNSSVMINPRRVTLMLRSDTRLGRDISFIPASRPRLLGAFQPDPVARELIERIDQLRQHDA